MTVALVQQACVNGLSTVGRGILDGYCWCGRRVEKLLCDYITDETVRKAISAFVWAIPYTIIYLLPGEKLNYFTGGVSIGLLKGLTREIDGITGEDHRQHIARGIRNAAIIRICIDIVVMIAKRDILKIIPILYNAEIADQANMLSVLPTPPEPPPEEPEQQPDAPPAVPENP